MQFLRDYPFVIAAGRRLRGIALIARRRLWLCYLALALPIVAIHAIMIPPLFAPDESAHVVRAVAVSELRLFHQTIEGQPRHIVRTPADYAALQHAINLNRIENGSFSWEPVRSVPPGSWRSVETVTGSAAANYFPLAYIPQALVIAVARSFGVSVVDTLIYGRLVLGVLFAAIASLAIQTALRGRFAIFIILSLPMTLNLGASFSPDAWLIASAALGGAAATRIVPGRVDATRWLRRYGLVLVFLTLLKPVNAALLLCMTSLGSIRWQLRTKLVFAVATIAATAWTLFFVAPPDRVADGIDAGSQLAFLLSNPLNVFRVAAGTFSQYPELPFRSLYGFTDHPNAYAGPGLTIFLSLVIIALFVSRPQPARTGAGETVLALTGMGLAAGLIYGALYLAWTPVGHLGPVHGVQGRYFLPVVLMGLAFMPGVRLPRPAGIAVALVYLALAIYFFLLTLWMTTQYFHSGA